jgi:hypothetical protein
MSLREDASRRRDAKRLSLQLSRAGRSETLRIEEVSGQQAAPILQQYLKRVPVVRPFFDVAPDSPLEEFAAEAWRHAVCRLIAE